MTNTKYQLECGNFSVSCTIINPETLRYFKGYLKKCTGQTEASLAVTPEYMNENRWLINEDEKSEGYLEFQTLMLKLGNSLLTHNRALFHGVAMLWKKHAWIITAPSGTGKTTQLKHWHDLLKNDMKIINGDKPLLECREDGTIWVHSSPWRGKERYGHPDLHAQLGGMILLQQEKHNVINQLNPKEAVIPLFSAFVSAPENTDQINGQAEILRKVIKAVPVWKLENLGDEESAILTINTLKSYLGKEL